jgi:PRC-barrel domain
MERYGASDINNETVAPEKPLPRSLIQTLAPLRFRGLFRPKIPLGCLNKGANTMATMERDTMERETTSLIGSDKVQGTTVYGIDGSSIGTIQRVMIDKISGKVAYAVTSFGGFLGMGEDYYPLPWSQLKYDTGLGGYRANLTEAQLKGAPKYSRSQEWDWSDRSNDRRVTDYYKM